MSSDLVDRRTRAAVVVAHPDDEIIWCGGLILQRPDWDWTVLSLCRADDTDREPKFRAVCAHIGATGHISDLDDSSPPAAIDARAEIGGRVGRILGEQAWDIVLTHGADGEYGHLRHRQVHAEVLRLVGEGVLGASRLWCFAYVCENPQGNCLPAGEADRFEELSDSVLAEKKRIVAEMYGYPPDGFEVLACICPEAFRVVNLQKGIES
jgi:LmbE family N-acetylglucosaminyl deacetylase